MTATYDGILTVGPRAKSVGACCRAMDEAAMRGQFYISQKGALMLRRSDRPNAGQECIACPFCGARVGSDLASEFTERLDALRIMCEEQRAIQDEDGVHIAVTLDPETFKALRTRGDDLARAISSLVPHPMSFDVESPMYAALCEQAERGEGPLAVPEGME